jgi:hypothetical protein
VHWEPPLHIADELNALQHRLATALCLAGTARERGTTLVPVSMVEDD